MKLFLSTGNKGKVAELIPLLREFFPEFKEIIPRAPLQAEETAETFVGNAQIKSEALAQELIAESEPFPFAVLSDDSGLEVAALNGQPGVHSARYSGEHSNSEENIKKLLCEMALIRNRGCRYVCCLYLHIQASESQSHCFHSEGYCVGLIMQEAMGEGGFGYDPIFWSSELNKRMSEASLSEKNQCSHRRQAFEKLALIYSA
ncbi:MAG: non-canonical purine NTP pyrophosphatase [Bdellovibrionota bacterium]